MIEYEYEPILALELRACADKESGWSSPYVVGLLRRAADRICELEKTPQDIARAIDTYLLESGKREGGSNG